MSAARLGAMKQAASALLRRPARARSLYTFATPGEVDIPNVPVPEYVTEVGVRASSSALRLFVRVCVCACVCE
ncbi:hypothetical protein EON68_04740 [archaeon]|nr:MAG: hypothetical protein EON68_04740 [archaeon]